MKKILFLALTLLIGLNISSGKEKREYYLNIYPYHTIFLPQEEIVIGVNARVRGKLKEGLKETIWWTAYSLEEEEIKKWSNLEEKDLKRKIKGIPAVKRWQEKIVFKPSSYEWNYVYSKSKISFKKKGHYLIIAKMANCEDYAAVHITEIGLIVKYTPTQILTFVQNLRDGKPIKGAEIFIHHNGKEIYKSRTTSSGLDKILTSNLKIDKPASLKIFARYGEDKVYTNLYLSKEKVQEFKAYLYTDRPVYRPEQEVYFKGILRNKEEEELIPPQDEEVEVVVKDPKGDEVYKKRLRTNKFGSISDSFRLSEEPPLGRYNICVNYKGQLSYAYFQVQEYRKPEYEIDITSPKKNWTADEEVIFNITAKYYFGAVVPNTDFNWTINYLPYYPYYRDWWEEDYYPSYKKKYFKSGTGKTDKLGKATISFKPPKLDYDARYIITVRMRDISRREVTNSHTILISKGNFYLTLRVDKYIYRLNEKVKVNISTKSYEGDPKSVLVYLKLKKRSKDRLEEVWEKSLKTNDEGLAYYEFIPDMEGYFEVFAYSFDKMENKIASSAYFLVSDKERIGWYHSSSLEIKTDKKFYEVGDIAKILINIPYKEASCLLTLEGDEIYYNKVLTPPSNSHLIEIKIMDYYSPNVHISLSFYYEKNLQKKSIRLIVPAKKKMLSVQILMDKQEYRPRDLAKFRLKTHNFKGQPVMSEVSLGVVDESIYAIHQDTTPQLEKFFYGERYNKVKTSASIWERAKIKTYPQMIAAQKAVRMTEVEAPASSKMGVSYAPTIIREYFPDTCYFNPYILTDEKGEAIVNISLPDTLTTWRATARAHTLDTKVGESLNKFTTTKGLLVRLITPRFITERDKLKISGVVHNYLKKDKEVLIELKGEGIKIKSPYSHKVLIPKNSSYRIDWEVYPLFSGLAKFKLSALSDEESDAMELTIPILPHGTEKYIALAGKTEETKIEKINLPEYASQNSSSLRIILSPSLASTILQSLEYLAGYPYGCVEQTMSRFLPTVIVAKTLQELDIYNEKLNAELPLMVKKGLQRLYNFQHSDGGWGWWQNDNSHPFMTAYVVYGLVLAKEAGFEVEESRIKKGKEWLKRNYKEEKDLNTKAYILYSLSEAGYANKEWMKDNYLKIDKFNDYAKALLSLVLYKNGMKEEAKEVIAKLEENALETKTSCFWEGKSGQYGWMDNEIETTAFALKALIKIKPQSKIIPKIVHYLATKRKGRSFHSTKDTAAVVFALTDYLKNSQELHPHFTTSVYLNDKLVKELKFKEEDLGKEGVEIEIAGNNLKYGENKIKFEKEGKGVLYYSTYLKYYTKEENIEANEAGFKVERRYISQTLNSNLQSPNLLMVNSGDIIEVKLTIIADGDYEYVIIEDPKPAGCEVVKEDSKYGYWNYWFSHREVRDEKTVWFVTYLNKGKKEITYKLRAETPGVFHTMPTKVYLMYLPEIGGGSKENIVEIKE